MSVPADDRDAVARFFGLDDRSDTWLAALPAEPAPVALPDPDSLADTLGRVGGDPRDLADLEALRPHMQDPAVNWLFECCVQQLVDSIGVVSGGLPWPGLTPEPAVLGRYFYVFVFLAAVPHVRAFHRERGITDEVSWASLGDLGQQMGVHRKIWGVGGLHTQTWLTLPYAGLLYQLGRLQFNLGDIGYADELIRERDLPFKHGDPALGVHIPERGRLDPAACDESLHWAAEFFPRHFPEREHKIATCYSWLLDPQLAEYLPADSNVVQFQRRFSPVSDGQQDDAAVFEFVFRKITPSLDELPQNTTLEKAVVAHLRSGRHWRAVPGWLTL